MPPLPTDSAETSTPSAEQSACVLTAADAVTMYDRPSTEAARFGQLASGETQRLSAQADGWFGFDPGTAQAANVGPFRLRWVAAGGPFQLEGSCDELATAPRLPPRTCFMMAMDAVPVRAQPGAGSDTVATLSAEGYAPVKRFDRARWAQVTLADGRSGWIAPEDGNFNGDCDLSR